MKILKILPDSPFLLLASHLTEREGSGILNLNKLLITWYGRKSPELDRDIDSSLTATGGSGQGSSLPQASLSLSESARCRQSACLTWLLSDDLKDISSTIYCTYR